MGLKIQSAAKSKHTHAHAQHQEAISKIGGKLDSKIPRPYSNERKKKKTPNLIRGIGVEDGGKGVEEVGREGEIAGEEWRVRAWRGRSGRSRWAAIGDGRRGKTTFSLVLETSQKTKFEIAGEGMGQAKGTCFILPSLLPLLLSFLLYLLQIMSYGEFYMFLYKKYF